MIRIILGYLAAIYFAVVAIILTGFLYGIRGDAIGMSAFIVLIVSIPYSVIQSIIIIAASEFMYIKHPAYYISCGMLVGVIALYALFKGQIPGKLYLQMVVIAGAVGGFVYWLIAGRYAGNRSKGNSA
jgi:hypothetical protein